jgi:hypothetical protein
MPKTVLPVYSCDRSSASPAVASRRTGSRVARAQRASSGVERCEDAADAEREHGAALETRGFRPRAVSRGGPRRCEGGAIARLPSLRTVPVSRAVSISRSPLRAKTNTVSPTAVGDAYPFADGGATAEHRVRHSCSYIRLRSTDRVVSSAGQVHEIRNRRPKARGPWRPYRRRHHSPAE